MIRKPRHVITPALLDNKKKTLFNGVWRVRKRRWYEKYGYPPNYNPFLANFFEMFVLDHFQLIQQTTAIPFEVPPQTTAVPFEDPRKKMFLEEQRKEGIVKSLLKIGKDAKKRPKYIEKRVQTLFRGKNAIQSRNKHYLKPKCKY